MRTGISDGRQIDGAVRNQGGGSLSSTYMDPGPLDSGEGV